MLKITLIHTYKGFAKATHLLSDPFKNTRRFTDACGNHGNSFYKVGVDVNGRLADHGFESSPEEEIQTTSIGRSSWPQHGSSTPNILLRKRIVYIISNGVGKMRRSVVVLEQNSMPNIRRDILE